MIRALLCILSVCLFVCASPREAAAQGPVFELRGVAFPTSAYLSPEELKAVTDPYMNRPITFSDVQAMLQDVQRLYAAAGVVTAKVLLPPQDVADGILRLDLVEARIGKVRVDVEHTNADFLTDRLALKPGAPPDYDAIAEDIRLFGLAYDIRPTLAFEAGTAAGTSDVVIRADTPKRWRWVVSVDNFASENLGRWQTTATAQVHSLTGVRDTLSLSVGAGEGVRSGTVTYRRPVGLGGGALFGSASMSRNQVVAGRFAVLDSVSDKTELRFGYQRFAFVTAKSHWRFSGQLYGSRSKSEILRTSLVETDLREVSFTAAHVRTFGKARVSGSLTLEMGTTDTGNVAATDGEYRVLTGAFSYGRPLGANWSAQANLRTQWTSDKTLPSAKLFTVGSVTSMRGYPDSVVSGLDGYDLRLQLVRSPIAFDFANAKMGLSPFAFVDAASVQPVAQGSERVTVTSVGAGVRGTLGEKAALFAMLANPLDQVQGQEQNEGAKFYFGLDYTF